MLRFLKRFSWVGVLAMSLLPTAAFVFQGPNASGSPNGADSFEVPSIGYNANNLYVPDTSQTGPKNIGEEYRRNMPVLYYSFDQNFLDYFGSNGIVAVDAATAVFNSLTNVSQYSADLSEFPLESAAQNYQAQALGLSDLKSQVMALLVEQLGLANPNRYVWTLYSRFLGNPPPCPDGMGYYVIQRNFEIVPSTLDQFQYSSYVNGALFSYAITEYCAFTPPPFGPLLADAVEIPVDPLTQLTAVAANIPIPILLPVGGANLLVFSSSLPSGGYFNGLTRDDVAGLRALMRTNNMNVESAGPGTTVAATNFNSSQLLFTSNLTLLVNQALTNDAATLLGLYPGLVVSSTTPIFTNLVTTNVAFYFTNLPWSPAGSPATLVFSTNQTTNVVTWFSHSFANVVTNTYYTNGFITVLTTNVTPPPYAPPGVFVTNVTATTLFTNFINGDYFILPANSDCGVSIVNTQLVSVFNLTNTPVVATNATGTTNVAPEQFSQSLVFYFTNRVFVIHPVPCLAAAVSLRQGIERVQFVRRDFDSLIGQFYEPITNQYTLIVVTNSALQPQTVFRRVTQPDILFTAQNLTSVNTDGGLTADFTRSLNFNTANALPNLAGPGTIEPNTTITFNKVAPFYLNEQVAPGFAPFLDQLTAVSQLIWSSFDGTTNAPVVYPNGTSIQNLENQVLILISPLTLSTGRVAVAYSQTFTVTGGSSPYTWSLAPGTPALPPGLNLSAGGNLTGTPTVAGTYDIVVRLTDGGARTVDRPYAITITNP
ncbi:MAG: hypothetical protein EXS35_06625 [Pedosphaera sp.]|nr:hypothetical protein [Pedosphaera sp.]